MNVAKQRETFIAAMMKIQDDRKAELGGRHIWQKHLDRYGPRAYFYELAGILSRLEELIINKPDNTDYNVPKILDLLTDLGNYDNFLFDWFNRQARLDDVAELKRLAP